MNLKYTTFDISKKLDISERTVRRRIEKLINIEKGRYEVSEEILQLIEEIGKSADRLRTPSGQASDTLQTGEAPPSETGFDHVEYFTDNEYQEFHKRLSEYPLLKEQLANSKEYLDTLKNELEYHKSAYLRQLDIHEKMIDSVKQRNFIEAKEKGMDDTD
jgi:DNA-binding Lrp family transcriptional regulator